MDSLSTSKSKIKTHVYTNWNFVGDTLGLILSPRPGSPSIRALLLLRLLLRLLLQAEVSNSWSRPHVLIVASHVVWSLVASTWWSSRWSPGSKTVRLICSHSRRARSAPTWAVQYLWKRGARTAYKTPTQKQSQTVRLCSRLRIMRAVIHLHMFRKFHQYSDFSPACI